MSRDKKTLAYKFNSYYTSSNSLEYNNKPNLIPPYASNTIRRLNKSTIEDRHIKRKELLLASTQT
jgi:hypothetical protein